MEVDESLIEQDIKTQLAELNDGWEHLLGLSGLYLLKGYKAVDWGKEKLTNLKHCFKKSLISS